MSNYEHLFEIAMGYISDEKSFDEFVMDNLTLENIHREFNYVDSFTEDLVKSVWDIANYVAANYIANNVDCSKCAWNGVSDSTCDKCVYKNKYDCYLEK